ncbi:putative phosphatidylcholine-sterol acyltransferase [Paratrimastix pyriformis]|uniref:Phosphatidylcholine-sterol acyltransferase n=1 Tax=Paratrimastix pyriformis TaxID=342808 RepID=A0ABQ8UCI0_9EUKA|nr:putative phosphatidylcholine-sterol acyltransferase [Paratrimastix pyriformis]
MRLLGLILAFSLVVSATKLAPIIIVPGLSASVLDTRFHKTVPVPHAMCEKNVNSWKKIWVSLTEFAPEVVDCFMQTISPSYDAATSRYNNCPGVEIQPRDFGGVGGIYAADPDIKGPTKFYGVMIDYLEKLGYKVGETIFGAPYDWRVSDPVANHHNGQYAALQTLVEQVVNQTGRRPHLIGHSLGSPFIHLFLATYTTQEWRDQYVGSFISLAGPLGGSPQAAEFAYCGLDWRIPGLTKTRLRDLTKHMGGVAWMMPYGPSADYTVISTPQANYTAATLAQMYADAGEENTAAMVKSVQTYLNKAAILPPGVETHLFYSLNTSTALTYTEPAGHACAKEGGVPIANRPGDDTVPDVSLLAFQHWLPQKQALHTYQVSDAHADIVKDPAVNQLIYEIANGL